MFESLLRYRFKNKGLLLEALTHKSFALDKGLPHNERLEFLGDSVLQLIITTLIYNHYSLDEGAMTQKRSYFVSRDYFQILGSELRLSEFLLTSLPKKHHSRNNVNSRIVSNTFEAVFGAVLQDSSFATTKKLFCTHFGTRLLVDFESHSSYDYKKSVQEYSLKEYSRLPEYKLISRRGPDHACVFESSLSVGGEVVSRGKGSSIKRSEQDAALSALQSMGMGIDMGIIPVSSSSLKSRKKPRRGG